MTVIPAGQHRRTPIERSDQRISWERADQAFFAAGACHILAWTCRDSATGTGIELAGMMTAGNPDPFHVYARCDGWAFDFSGWHPESELLRVNADFENTAIDSVPITVELAEFCALHRHRMPHEFWRDPIPRARAYLDRWPPRGR